MERVLVNRRWSIALTIGLMAAGYGVVPPAAAQQPPGSRFRVLVPSLEQVGVADKKFGRTVADELRKRIDELPTHAPVSKKDMDRTLKQYKVKEEDLDCIKARQLAVQMNAELVMCGRVEAAPAGGFTVTASFIGAKTGETFEVEPLQVQDPKEAAERVYRAFESYTNTLRLTVFCNDYLNSQQWPNALNNCRQALELNPQSKTAMYGAARALMEMDSLEASLGMLQRLLEVDPTNLEGLLAAGYAAAKLQQPEVSRGYYRQYLELNPGSTDVRLKVATDLLNAGDPEGALRLAEEGLATDSANLTLHEYTGHYALAAAQRAAASGNGSDGPNPQAVELFETALRHYEKVFEARGDSADATMLGNMMATLMQLDRNQEAVALGARIVAAKPGEPGLWSSYGNALQRAGRLDAALAALDSVLARDPKYPNVFARQVLWFAQAGRIADARQAKDKAVASGEVQSADDLARAIFSYAYNQQYRKGQVDAAIRLFELTREFATTPQTRAMAAFWIGFPLYERGRKVQEPQTVESAKEALPIFQRALENFEQSGPYAETERSINLPNIIAATKQYIEIQELLIKRGR